jgi:hypothetical protein
MSVGTAGLDDKARVPQRTLRVVSAARPTLSAMSRDRRLRIGGAAATLVVVALAATQTSSSLAASNTSAARNGTCRLDAERAAACAVVERFFTSVRRGRYEKACRLLGAQLRAETGGSRCPSVVAIARAGAPAVIGARLLHGGVGVEVVTFVHELGRERPLRWLAVVATEGDRLKIVQTDRLA